MTIHLHLGPVTVRNVAAPRPEDVHIPTILDRIGRIRRFGGHPDALTVLQHCRLTKALAVQDNVAWRVIQWAWRHDWHEAVTGDIPAPVKRAIASPALRDLERAWDDAIARAETIQPPDEWVRREVSRYDRMACRLEMEALCMTADPYLPPVPAHIDPTEAWAYAIGREALA